MIEHILDLLMGKRGKCIDCRFVLRGVVAPRCPTLWGTDRGRADSLTANRGENYIAVGRGSFARGNAGGVRNAADRGRNSQVALYTGRRCLAYSVCSWKIEWPGVGVMYQMRPDGEKPGPLYRLSLHTQAAFARSTMLTLDSVTPCSYTFSPSSKS